MKPNIERCIFSIVQQKNKDKESKEFVVEVDDCIGDYLESLLNIIEKHNSRGVNLRKASNIDFGDLLVFTKNEIYIKKNYVSNSKVYSLVSDYYKIKEMIKNLYKDNLDNLPHKDCKNCPYYKSGKKFAKQILFDNEYIDIDEKVSIFNNFVKIGYDTFDIKNDLVNINGTIYEVVTNDIFVKSPKKESLCSQIMKKCLKMCK
jgi:hypothetical protein